MPDVGCQAHEDDDEFADTECDSPGDYVDPSVPARTRAWNTAGVFTTDPRRQPQRMPGGAPVAGPPPQPRHLPPQAYPAPYQPPGYIPHGQGPIPQLPLPLVAYPQPGQVLVRPMYPQGGYPAMPPGPSPYPVPIPYPQPPPQYPNVHPAPRYPQR
ncbi:hypothetical protein DACRYDRAFT_23740 [Dacryopinax primogenitus]|uniref:Uncharacterized protein n=1 Tax=Dacryopinax primogenitus (strain DJM 731) TaxID=1858805 RepID=M5G7F8_DACPD|nr:uncharacterized protein DACRYDRAFT_23740 [Dacryopinax primogenitus]EJT99687.1 hypothetical protein DACRYDRAFT_23740 [Dacryopinax primogenitus]